MRYISTIFMFLALFGFTAMAQDNGPVKASETGFMPKPILVPGIAKQIAAGTLKVVDPNEPARPGHPKQRGLNNIIPGKGVQFDIDPLVENQKKAANKAGKEALLVFNANVSPYTPSDPTGAAGPNHFVGAWNTGFRIFDKSGNPLTPAANLSTLFPGNNMGDPIVLYDVEADRFIITEFDSSPNGLNVAICQGPDPVNDDWFVYTTGFTTGSFPDYPKFSIWSDGYYVTANIGASNKVFVMEREVMLLGNTSQFVALPLTGIATSGFYSPQFFNVTNGDLPPAGNAYVVYLQDDAWGGVSTDHLKLWTVNVDWQTTTNSSISAATQIPTAPFISVFDGGSFNNRPQPAGPNIDVLQATIMNQAQYRRFAGYNSALFNFVVDTDGSSGELAGIRWYELRQYGDGEPWEIYQEGTYISPNNNKDAFSGSMAMDMNGNIGMGYTTVSSTEKIAIYYTGRYANDPLGQMTIDETLLAQSSTNDPSNRLADYVHLTVDPTNDKTFWHIAEYFNAGARTDVVGVFQIAPNYINDLGVSEITSPVTGSLTDAEAITVTVFNGGEAEQSNFTVSYQIDGGDVVSETFTSTLISQAYESFTFAQTADLSIMGQSYTIKAFTSLDMDEDISNDTATAIVKFLGPNDLGIELIVSPTSGENLTSDESVVVQVKNYGTQPQSNFDVSYIADGTQVTESLSGTVQMGETHEFTFSQTVDMSVFGVHNMQAFTSLNNDIDMNNDTVNQVVVNSNCLPASNCGGGHAIELFQLGTIANVSECSANGYGDYVNLSTDLDVNSSNDFTLSTGFGNQYVKVWIDFNDDFTFGSDEVVSGFIVGAGQGAGNYTVTNNLVIPAGANLGEHLLRVKLSWILPIGDEDACEDILEGGETEDYMVNVILPIGIEPTPVQNAEMSVTSMGNNHFRALLVTEEYEKPLRIDVHNAMGQCVIHNRVVKANGNYTYDIDMSYAPKGVYIVRFGTDDYGKVRKIVVK